jgi:uncharacterized protein YhfF
VTTPSIEVQKFWQSFCSAYAIDAATPFQAFYFGMDQPLADSLALLVAKGQKRGTAGLLQTSYEDPNDQPFIGGYCVITNFAGKPVAVTRTVALHLFRFRDVPAWFAEREGEDEGVGEVCLASWKEGHKRFFAQHPISPEQPFNEDMEIVCESFDILYVDTEIKHLAA